MPKKSQSSDQELPVVRPWLEPTPVYLLGEVRFASLKEPIRKGWRKMTCDEARVHQYQFGSLFPEEETKIALLGDGYLKGYKGGSKYQIFNTKNLSAYFIVRDYIAEDTDPKLTGKIDEDYSDCDYGEDGEEVGSQYIARQLSKEALEPAEVKKSKESPLIIDKVRVLKVWKDMPEGWRRVTDDQGRKYTEQLLAKIPKKYKDDIALETASLQKWEGGGKIREVNAKRCLYCLIAPDLRNQNQKSAQAKQEKDKKV